MWTQCDDYISRPACGLGLQRVEGPPKKDNALSAHTSGVVHLLTTVYRLDR